MSKRTFASLSDVDDAYLTPNDDESREDRKRRKANKRKAKSRWDILHRAATRSEQPLTERILNATRMAVHRQQMSPEERRASRSRHALQVANQRALQSGPARQCARATNNAQHRARTSQGSGTKLCALATIENYQEHHPRHTIGSMTTECIYCHALTWKSENASTCCLDGRVGLAPPNDPPAFLKKFVSTPASLRQIRAYNNVFAFTSMGASIGEKVAVDNNYANGRQGVYTFRVQGTICHRIGSLLPEEGSEPSFAQVYVYDSDLEHQVDRRMHILEGLDRPTVKALQQMLMANNPYVKQFLTAGEKARNGVDLRLVIHEQPGTDLRTHNRPSADEVAAIIVDENSAKERDIVLSRRGGGLQRISDLHPAYDPLEFPLLFPFGEQGWSTTVEYKPGVVRYRNKRMKVRDFYVYQLFTRVNQFSILHRSSRLFQQWCVEMYVKIELQRLRYIKLHQSTFRADLYRGVIDAVLHDANLGEVGRFVLLPPSFIGGERYMRKQYYDSMAIVREIGKPDLFITITCNPDWPEIKEAMLQNQRGADRPDLVARAFKLKLEAIKDDIIKNEVFGKVRALIYVIEFQKRGLPHAHMLVKLTEESSPRRSEDYDKFVCAELPDPNTHPELYQTVTKCMIHGPCGILNPKAPCMKDGVCSKGYPKDFHSDTTREESGYPEYRRRDQGRSTMRKNVELDNRWVVPYNPYLCETYNCHINVEICSTINAIKYMYKYIYKGQDRATFTVEAPVTDVGDNTNRRIDIDEVEQYLSGRYICPPEACWRMLKYPMQWKSHAVIQLPVHLPEMNYTIFNPEHPERIPEQRHTMLTRFFETCAADVDASELLYYEFPRHYTWAKEVKNWRPRKQDGEKAIGRMVSVSPNDTERFYLRLLLCNVRGPTSFEFLRTINDTIHETYQAAAEARGLLESDGEWHRCMEEASQHQMPNQLRRLFAIILVHCHPGTPKTLWDAYMNDMSEDFQRDLHQSGTSREVIYQTVRAVDQCLRSNNKTIEDFRGLPKLADFSDLHPADATTNRLIETELSYDQAEMEALRDRADRLNDDQRNVYDKVISAVQHENSDEKLFFLDGPGGTGKSFLLQTILATTRLKGKIALAAASSGIAATQLMGGRTAHYTFQLGLDLTSTSTCNVTVGSDRADLLRQTSLIVWDEAPLMIKYGFQAVDITLRDLMKNDKPFGGKVMLLAGDFRQILPVIPHGAPGQVVNSCIKRSSLWTNFSILHLKTNMRVQGMTNETTAMETQTFADFLLRVGEGLNQGCIEGGRDYTRIQQDMVLAAPADVEKGKALIDHVYDGIEERYLENDYFAGRAILTPLNADVLKINDAAIEALPGTTKEYVSIDTVESAQGSDTSVFPEEFLNSLSISGMPPHILRLKVGAPIILLRNINGEAGLCNGTRLQVCHMHDHYIEAKVLTGILTGKVVVIPRIPLISHNSGMPFELRRRQFPVQLAFAMTINKAQGQTLRELGIYLPQPVFAHGQLYVALSRATCRRHVKIAVDYNAHREEDGYCILNVVYKGIVD